VRFGWSVKWFQVLYELPGYQRRQLNVSEIPCLISRPGSRRFEAGFCPSSWDLALSILHTLLFAGPYPGERVPPELCTSVYNIYRTHTMPYQYQVCGTE